MGDPVLEGLFLPLKKGSSVWGKPGTIQLVCSLFLGKTCRRQSGNFY